MKKLLLFPVLLLISVNASADVMAFINSTNQSSIKLIYQSCYMENGRELRCLEPESVTFFMRQEIVRKEIAVPNGQVVRVTGLAAIVNNGNPIYFSDDCRVELKRDNTRPTLKLIEFGEIQCYGV